MSEPILDAYWRELVTVALLGTDRREPPAAPPGPLADTIADTVRLDDGSQLIAAVAVVTAARRAAFMPLAAAPPLHPPEPDRRPFCIAIATHSWRQIISEWSVLEDEWLLTVLERGWRLPPDVLVELLIRHRHDPVRRARSMLVGGPTARWVVEHVDQLASGSANTPAADAVTTLPELAMPPELAELASADAHTFVRRLLPGFETGEYGAAHRAVLVNLLARCRREVLPGAAAALALVGSGLALALADLARLRHRMLVELDVR